MTARTSTRSEQGEVLRRWRKRDRQWRFTLRFWFVHPDTGERHREVVPLGLETDGWNERRARLRLADLLEEVAAGVYRPPVVEIAEGDRDPTFHVHATRWLGEKRAEIERSTYDDYRNLLVNHLLPFFKDDRLTEINFDRIKRYRTERLALSRKLHDAKAAGAPLTTRGRDGRRVQKRLFGARQINASIALLGRVLATACKSEAYDVSQVPSRDSELRVKASRREARRHLEADEVVELLAAALDLDNPVSSDTMERAALVRHLRDEQRLPWALIAQALDCAPTTAMWLHRRVPEAFPPRHLRAAIAMLALAGGRNQEIAARRWEQIDFSHLRVVVPTSKSVPREIEMSPFFVEEMALYFHSLPVRPAAGDLVLTTRDGQQRTRHNLNNNVLAPVVRRANERRLTRGAAPLPPNITPHTLRRSFVTMSAQRGKSLSWIVHQIGHKDYSTTLRYYQQATAHETLPHIVELLDLLFGKRPIVGLDQFDTLVTNHDLDRAIAALTHPRVLRPIDTPTMPDISRAPLALVS